MWAAFISSGGGSLVTCEYLPSVTRAKSYRVLLNAAVTKRRDVSVVQTHVDFRGAPETSGALGEHSTHRGTYFTQKKYDM